MASSHQVTLCVVISVPLPAGRSWMYTLEREAVPMTDSSTYPSSQERSSALVMLSSGTLPLGMPKRA